MAISYPLSIAAFADQLRANACRFAPQFFQSVTGFASGQTVVVEQSPALWQARVELATMKNDDAQDINALLESLVNLGSSGGFWFYDIKRHGPRADPTGAILSGSTPTIYSIPTAGSIRIAGLPNNYRISRGDLFSVLSSGQRVLMRAAETAVASGAGITPIFDVIPGVRANVEISQAVVLYKPSTKMIIDPASYDPGLPGLIATSGIAFTAMELTS